MARVSIKDIAEKLNISPSTVSLVLNGKDKKVRISEKLAEKVRQTAKELNYTPNMAARSLRTRKTKTIGLIVADISNPFFSKLARYIENIATQKGYQVIFGSSDESKTKFQNLCDVFVGKWVDGMIVVPPYGGDEALLQLIDNKIPLVIIDRESESIPVNTVKMDNLKASYSLTTHLIEQGAKKIGLLGHNKNFSNVTQRYEGYRKALSDHNIPLDGKIVQLVELEDFDGNVEKALKILVANKIDSIFFITSKVGRQSLYSLKNNNILENYRYASIDLFDECRLSNIDLSCIEQPLDIMCEKALTILFKQIEDSRYEIIENVTLHPPQIKFLNGL